MAVAPQVDLLLKAVINKTKLEKKLQHQKVPHWRTKTQLQAINDLISSNMQPILESDVQNEEFQEQEGFARNVLDKARGVLTKNRVLKKTHQLDELLHQIKKDSTAEDQYNQLVLNSIFHSERQHVLTPNLAQPQHNLHFSKKSKLNTEPIQKSYQSLPKIVVGHVIKRKQEVLKNLNKDLVQQQQAIQLEALKQVYEEKLPQIYESLSARELKNPETLLKQAIRGEFSLINLKKRPSLLQIKQKPPSFLQSFRQFHKQLIRQVDFQQKMNQIDNQQIKTQLANLDDYLGTEFHKLSVKTEFY